jgi:hypothetical protein
MTTFRYIFNSGQSNFEYEYLGKFETEFKNILGHESGAQVCSFDGKKQRSKISCYCPFNVPEDQGMSKPKRLITLRAGPTQLLSRLAGADFIFQWIGMVSEEV